MLPLALSLLCSWESDLWVEARQRLQSNLYDSFTRSASRSNPQRMSVASLAIQIRAPCARSIACKHRDSSGEAISGQKVGRNYAPLFCGSVSDVRGPPVLTP
jgi:hypothetical protein